MKEKFYKIVEQLLVDGDQSSVNKDGTRRSKQEQKLLSIEVSNMLYEKMCSEEENQTQLIALLDER